MRMFQFQQAVAHQRATHFLVTQSPSDSSKTNGWILGCIIQNQRVIQDQCYNYVHLGLFSERCNKIIGLLFCFYFQTMEKVFKMHFTNILAKKPCLMFTLMAAILVSEKSKKYNTYLSQRIAYCLDLFRVYRLGCMQVGFQNFSIFKIYCSFTLHQFKHQ